MSEKKKCSSCGGPNNLARAQHFATALGRAGMAFVRGQDVLVSEGVFAARMAHCLACENCIPHPTKPEFHQCKVCTCWLDSKYKLKAKAWLTTESCPLPEPKWKATT